MGWLVWRPPHQFEKWCGRGMVSPHKIFGGNDKIYQKCSFAPPPRREKLFKDKNTVRPSSPGIIDEFKFLRGTRGTRGARGTRGTCGTRDTCGTRYVREVLSCQQSVPLRLLQGEADRALIGRLAVVAHL